MGQGGKVRIKTLTFNLTLDQGRHAILKKKKKESKKKTFVLVLELHLQEF